jgi:hypothetical protein
MGRAEGSCGVKGAMSTIIENESDPTRLCVWVRVWMLCSPGGWVWWVYCEPGRELGPLVCLSVCLSLSLGKKKAGDTNNKWWV